MVPPYGDDTPNLLRAIAGSTHAREFKHDVIFNAAADELDRLRGTAMSENPPVEPILQFFAYNHLPPDLQLVSTRFANLADHIVNELPRNPERTVALRKLLEAKDATVRAKLMK